MRNQLPYKVECKSNYLFFETIAAFNCDQPAFAYAKDCAEVNPNFEYRVTSPRWKRKAFKPDGSLA